MKTKRLLTLLFGIFVSTQMYAQKQDTLDILNKKTEIELKKREVELKNQELEIKKQEFEIFKENSIEAKEEKKEEKVLKLKKERTEEETKAENQLRMEKTTIVSFQPFSLVIGGLEVGIEKKVKDKLGLKLMVGYFYSENPWYYRSGRLLASGFENNYQYYTYNDGALTAEQIRIEIQAKMYANTKQIGLNGIYFAPFLQFKQMEKVDNIVTDKYYYNSEFSKETKEVPITAQMITAGLAIGYQFSKTPIAVDLNFSAGLGLPINKFDNKDFNVPVLHAYSRGGRPRIGFSVGFPF